jgi:uncharacterized protein (TIGR00290 family)
MHNDSRYEVGTLLTTVNAHYGRVSIHGLRKELLAAQTEAMGMPVEVVWLPEHVSNTTYEDLMAETTRKLLGQGYTHAGFGDIFLEDLRAYRERQLSAVRLEAVFPLWKSNTLELAHRFFAEGFQAVVVSVDAGKLDASFAGRNYDASFIKDLPAGVDPCGENGEFHTFCYNGPLFRHPVRFERGEKVYREYPVSEQQVSGFWYCDLF